ncbi:iron chaperone [Cumulibacter manganitolerans]|uniref:iron chaperone n=1 Tax=Cumulibacter manganitolerans TaxID=1884992 RepID=UPI0012970E50|nr:DUF1801 domain-containing protein [Cumulibacter manganitolerans]
MPAPKRKSVEDFFSSLEPHQRPHLDKLREISRSYQPRVSEELRFNQPAYVAEGQQWMLQAFGKHCSLRFDPEFFVEHQNEVTEAGYEHGAGFLKIPYDQDVPEELCRGLIEAKLAQTGK